MNRFSQFAASVVLMTLILSGHALSLPAFGNDAYHPGEQVAPGMAVDPGSFEFTLPHEVTGLATLTLTNTGGPVLQYGVTSTISAGFRGRYYNNAAGASPVFGDLVFERQDEDIDLNWQAGGPQNGVGTDNFGVRWDGIFIVPQNGRYAFQTNSDEGVRLFIDGQRVINDWQNHLARGNDWSGQITFGPHRIRLEYYEDRNNANCRLLWQPPGAEMTVMPGQSEKGWITMTPSRGNLAAGSSVDIAIAVDTKEFEVGSEYIDTLIVTSNDNENPTIYIPVSVFVTPWQPGEVEPAAFGVNRSMQPNAREQSQLTLHSVGRGNYEFEAEIEGNDHGWLSVSPASGSIGPGLDGTVTLSFNSTGRARGLYTASLILTGNDVRRPRLEIPVTMAIDFPVGTLYGRVTDLRTGMAVGGALIGVNGYGYTTEADDEGNFEFQVPAIQQRIWATADDYLRFESAEFAVEENQRLEVNVSLRQGTFDPTLDALELFFSQGDTMTFPLAVRNRGNGDVNWQGAIEFSDEHIHTAWRERFRFNISREGLQDNRINGVEFIDGHFYVSGGNEGRGYGKIYVFDETGEYVRDFDQFLEGPAFGMRDLAWDGELLYGSDNGVIYAFDLEGNLDRQFNGPINPSRAMAYDPANGLLLISDNQSDIFRMDVNGQLIDRIRNPGQRRFGMAWFNDDPDGFPLYMFTSSNEQPIAIWKYSLETNELRFVADLPGLEADRAGGLGITGTWDPYSWTLIAQMNSNIDAIALYHMASRTEWIDLVETEGVIEAGQTSDIEILLKGNGLVENQIYEASAVFRHEGLGGDVVVPVSVHVGEEGGASDRLISLSMGWNLISTNVLPEGGDDFSALLSPLVDEGSLILAKDGSGNFFWPSRNFDNIGEWNSLQGYWLKTNRRTQFRLGGELVPMETPIALNAGWNTISYLPRIPASPEVILGGLGDNLVIVRDGAGRFYLPAFNFSDMDVMREGFGYQIRVTEATELVYSFGNEAARVKTAPYSAADRDWLEELNPTGAMHNLLAQTSFKAGVRLEALTPSGISVGRGVVGKDGLCAVTLWGDDPSTRDVDGFITGDVPVIRHFGESGDILFELTAGSMEWTDGGWGVVTLSNAEMPVEFGISTAYPNPFNSSLHVAFSTNGGEVSLIAFDLAGRQTGVLVMGEMKAGTHRIEWNAQNLPTGIYMLKLKANGKEATRKVLLLK